MNGPALLGSIPVALFYSCPPCYHRIMTIDPRDLVIEIVRRMQGDLPELKEGQRAANRLFAAIESHMAGFHLTVAAHSDELADLKARIERIERRLELADPA